MPMYASDDSDSDDSGDQLQWLRQWQAMAGEMPGPPPGKANLSPAPWH